MPRCGVGNPRGKGEGCSCCQSFECKLPVGIWHADFRIDRWEFPFQNRSISSFFTIRRLHVSLRRTWKVILSVAEVQKSFEEINFPHLSKWDIY